MINIKVEFNMNGWRGSDFFSSVDSRTDALLNGLATTVTSNAKNNLESQGAVRTGNLRDSIRKSSIIREGTGKRVDVFADMYYATIQEARKSYLLAALNSLPRF